MTTDMGAGHGSLSMAEHPDIKALGERPERHTDASSAAHSLALLAGSYAAISAWVIGFSDQSPLAITDLIVGAGIVLVTLVMLRDRIRILAPVYALMGVWLIVAPWLIQHLDRTTGIIASNVAVGAVVVLAGTAVLAMTAILRRHR